MMHNEYTTMLVHRTKQAEWEHEAAMAELAAGERRESVADRVGGVWARLWGTVKQRGASAPKLADAKRVTGEFSVAP